MAGVDSHLRRAQVVFHIFVICGGLMACLGLGWDVRIFENNCMLYGHMGLNTRRGTTIDDELTEWGPMTVCYYCVFSTVVAIIYGIIWFWFYILLSKWDTTSEDMPEVIQTVDGDYRSPPDVRILLGTIFSSTILLFVQLVNLGFITVGGQQWCDSLKNSGVQCSDLEKLKWREEFQDVHVTYTYLQVAQAGSWILLLSIVAITVIVACRLHLHFSASLLKASVSQSELNSLYREATPHSPDCQTINLNKSFSSDKATSTTGTDSDDSQPGESSPLKKQKKPYNTL